MIYETEDNRTKENAFLSKIRLRFKCDSVKLPYSYKLDYALKRKREVSAWAELKVREFEMNTFPETVVAMDKVKMGLFYSENFGRWEDRFHKQHKEQIEEWGIHEVPFILFIRFLDRDTWVKIDNDLLTKCETKTLEVNNCRLGDPRANREHVFIPITYLKEF